VKIFYESKGSEKLQQSPGWPEVNQVPRCCLLSRPPPQETVIRDKPNPAHWGQQKCRPQPKVQDEKQVSGLEPV
jgi:hypothetical protein